MWSLIGFMVGWGKKREEKERKRGGGIGRFDGELHTYIRKKKLRAGGGKVGRGCFFGMGMDGKVDIWPDEFELHQRLGNVLGFTVL